MDFSFIDHLEILRKKLIVSIFIFLVAAAVSLAFVRELFDFLTQPIRGMDIDLVYIKPQEKVLTYLRTGLFFGAAAALPGITAELSSFIFPALKRSERGMFYATVFLALFFYLAGIVFAYTIILPFAITFFGTFSAGDGIRPLWSIGAYFRIASSIILAMALVFQLPCILLFLIRTGIASPHGVARYRKHVIIGILFAAAFLTPPDVFTQIVVGSVLELLFEGTLLAGKLMVKKKKERELYEQT